MPELPEVETIKNTLVDCVVGRVIISVELNYPALLKNAPVDDFTKTLEGKRIVSVTRRGKYLLFQLGEKTGLILHLRMTGQLRYNRPQEPFLKHTHFVWHLDNHMQLRYVDVRKFGTIFIGSFIEAQKTAGLERLGPEPLSPCFSLPYFVKALSSSKRTIKSLLLDQTKVVGLGNIYVDESLFRAGIHPQSPAAELPDEQVRILHATIRQVLQAGIDRRGTSMNDYVDGLGRQGTFQFELSVYGREKEQCRLCHTIIVREVIAGRSTHICTHCQNRYGGS